MSWIRSLSLFIFTFYHWLILRRLSLLFFYLIFRDCQIFSLATCLLRPSPARYFKNVIFCHLSAPYIHGPVHQVYVHTNHVKFVYYFVTPFILPKHQYCEVCVQKSSLLSNKYIARLSWKLKKEAFINTHGLKRSFKVLWTKYVTCIGLFVVLHSVIILRRNVLVSLLLVCC